MVNQNVTRVENKNAPFKRSSSLLMCLCGHKDYYLLREYEDDRWEAL